MVAAHTKPTRGHATGSTDARSIGLLLVVAVLAGCGEGAPQPATFEADSTAIADVNTRILDALNDGDVERLNALTDDDYVSIVGGRATSGRAQLEAGNRRFLEQWHNEEQWLPDETIVEGDLAFQRGTFTMRLTPRQGSAPVRNLEGTYMHVYQRKPDGTWALTRAMAATAEEN
jgi:ketosteroid isomerase-like protein